VKNQLSGPKIITQPSHYVEGRVFEPISVIEEFCLCHHLACVVKYIARAGRKTSLLNDLLKAEWYLDRKLSASQSSGSHCTSPLKWSPGLKVTAICKDWKLSPDLSEVLSSILQYRLATASQQTFQWIRGFTESSDSMELSNGRTHLLRAMEHLRLELAAHSREKLGCNELGADNE
jgi:hypothetical protein